MPNPELKEKLLAMMKWFHEYCVENNIRYYVIGGTLLGAIRHHGFIPWDDDMDVGVPRKDYENLLAMAGETPHNQYVFESIYGNADDYIYPHARIYDTSTTLVENTRNPIKRGICIDIFPLDGIGNTLQEVSRHFRKISFLLNIHTACTVKLKKGRPPIKNLIILLSYPIAWIINPKKIGKRINALCERIEFDSSKFCGNLVGRYRKREIVDRKVFGEPTLYQFENIEVFGVQNFNEYLTNVYGNWKEFPPSNQQVGMHNILYENLYEPYLVEEKTKDD